MDGSLRKMASEWCGELKNVSRNGSALYSGEVSAGGDDTVRTRERQGTL